jgi:DNA-binding NarL/FixJ family response regulator
VRTLIVDDSQSVRDGLSRLLRTKPFCELVGAVSDPEEALELTRTMRPHVVLQDFSMPGIDSVALMRDLRGCSPQPAVLVLSAFADAEASRRAMEAGATGWVLKDAEPEELFAALLGAAGAEEGAAADAPEAPARRPSLALAPPPPVPAAGEPEQEAAASLDARTVRALLRALRGDPGHLPALEISTRAVLPLSIATRYLKRMAARTPPLVATADGDSPPATYFLTSAGHRELARLERRHLAADPTGAAQRV